ncbi:hypothetical protein BB561_000400 [Smittium simulii]|uniref:PIH1 N-terminal domain-containing protein n=1 Tax=Smittium simulii TaxID=133385 RepID=A0A2T9YZA4_9FUNG|nr:hypothetical protein BB561_000400 [Smittium simulii]
MEPIPSISEPNSLLNVGSELKKKDLATLNEALKKEIRSHGYSPIELETDPSNIDKESHISGPNMPTIQSIISFKPFLSFTTAINKPSAKIKNSQVCINLCFSEMIPSPPTLPESEIQKAFAGAADAIWQVPMYTSIPRFSANCVVFDSIVNSSLFQRANFDKDTLLYLIELSFEWVEDKFDVALDRAFSNNPSKYFGKLATHFLEEMLPTPQILQNNTNPLNKPSETEPQSTAERLDPVLLKSAQNKNNLVLVFNIDVKLSLYQDNIPLLNFDLSNFDIFKTSTDNLIASSYYIPSENKMVLHLYL